MLLLLWMLMFLCCLALLLRGLGAVYQENSSSATVKQQGHLMSRRTPAQACTRATQPQGDVSPLSSAPFRERTGLWKIPSRRQRASLVRPWKWAWTELEKATFHIPLEYAQTEQILESQESQGHRFCTTEFWMPVKKVRFFLGVDTKPSHLTGMDGWHSPLYDAFHFTLLTSHKPLGRSPSDDDPPRVPGALCLACSLRSRARLSPRWMRSVTWTSQVRHPVCPSSLLATVRWLILMLTDWIEGHAGDEGGPFLGVSRWVSQCDLEGYIRPPNLWLLGTLLLGCHEVSSFFPHRAFCHATDHARNATFKTWVQINVTSFKLLSVGHFVLGTRKVIKIFHGLFNYHSNLNITDQPGLPIMQGKRRC